LVAHLTGGQVVAGSNPVSPTRVPADQRAIYVPRVTPNQYPLGVCTATDTATGVRNRAERPVRRPLHGPCCRWCGRKYRPSRQLNPFTCTGPTCTSSPASHGPNAMTVAFFAWYPVAKVVTWFRFRCRFRHAAEPARHPRMIRSNGTTSPYSFCRHRRPSRVQAVHSSIAV
jgi:hypothetical protein